VSSQLISIRIIQRNGFEIFIILIILQTSLSSVVPISRLRLSLRPRQ